MAVLGAGSWGTTIARLVAEKRSVSLWARAPSLADTMARARENATYLPGVKLPDAIRVCERVEDAVEGATIVLVAVPSHGFRSVLESAAASLGEGATVVSLAKGIEAGTNLRMSQVAAQVVPGHAVGVVSGPNFAREIAAGMPAAAVAAFDDHALAARVQDLLHRPTFRVYSASDVVGCEIAGATKNVIALASGVCDGMGLGESTRALLITRGLAEQARLGVSLGGQEPTFSGLAGVGDLVATCTSSLSRNRSVGYELGRGRSLEEILSGMKMVAEGVRTAAPIVSLAAACGVEMPIASQVAALVAGETSPAAAITALMERPPRRE